MTHRGARIAIHGVSPRAAAVLTSAALLAFAANSLLCRLALAPLAIDPRSFTAVRLASGAATLALLVRARGDSLAGSWRSAVALVAYALPFALAYRDLTAGTGALVLFGAVQITMFAAGLVGRERPGPRGWTGVAIAGVGLVVLVLPGLAAPPLIGVLSMALAGIAWGVYSLAGRGATRPLAATAGNFLRATPIALASLAIAPGELHARPAGIALAVASGAVASGLGYAIWYAALPSLKATQAATVQLAVPAIAAGAAILLLDEPLTLRWLASAVLVLGGIAIALTARRI